MRSELYINGTRVDLKEEISASITYAISDIKDPATRNGSYSKTIKLPGTKTINKLLTHIYDIAFSTQTSGIVNFSPDFNPNLKAYIVFYIDGLQQFRGYMKLLNIYRSQQDLELIEYDVVFIGEVSNIFGALGDSKMNQLTLAEYNHTYNKTNQKATWTNINYGSGYVYPMINYGGTPPGQWDVQNFYPAIYLKTYIDKIFEYAGYTYDSTFFDSDYFKRLIIPFNGDRFTISSASIANMLFAANSNADYMDTVIIPALLSSQPNPLPFQLETSDPSNQYNTATGTFTAASPGWYDFYFTGTFKADAVTNVQLGTNLIGNVSVIYVKTSGSGTTVYPGGALAPFGLAATYTAGQNIYTKSVSSMSGQIYLSTGDTVTVKANNAIIGINHTSGTVNFTISSGATFSNRISNTTIVDGQNLEMNSALPTDIRMADFLMSVFRRWNLFIEPDKTLPNKLIVRTYTEFYESGATRDWTHKLDVSKPAVITPMGALDAIRYRVSDSDDSDYWNKLYKDKWKETYGEKHQDVVNDFLQNQNNNEFIFAPTPLVGSNSNDRIIPEIYTLTNSGQQQPIRGKLRILYWGGQRTTLNPWTYTGTQSGTSTETTWPYAGHLDDPYNPTLDIGIFLPREIYYLNTSGTTKYTTNNVYNAYHSQHISEITDRNSKILTAYFWLTPADINSLSFRDRIFIDGHYYRIQRVVDYNPITPQPTKVELLKIKNGIPFTGLVQVINGAFDDVIGEFEPPRFGGNVGIGYTGNFSTNINVGRDNYISDSATDTTVSGNSNRVGDNAQRISILASSGVTVIGGVTDVSVINTNDITITESNTTYISGCKYASGQTNVYTVSQDTTIFGAGTYYCSGNITLTMDETRLREYEVVRVYNVGSGSILLSGGGLNILHPNNQSNPTFSMAQTYETVELKLYNMSYIMTIRHA